ncbi:FAD-dependent monooxygenase [Undibacterium sp. RuTC16W]|uniref:FAD-dependent monooxygenase n=1 Tax=Undibacterium sp. RuTC16W TaxID=3413048 RepID=UPI003BF33821
MKEKVTTDVLICGAGTAGLALAIDLARRGMSFRLIEKIAHPLHGSRGKGKRFSRIPGDAMALNINAITHHQSLKD